MSENSQANCPKCGHKREPSTLACPRCGLRFALWKPHMADPRTKLTPQAQELWNGVEANWQELSLHEAFAKHCLQANLLPAAGRCYRDRLVRSPGDPMATKMQAEILAKATLGLMVQQQRRPVEPVTRSKWFWFIIVAAMALAIAGAFIWGSGKKPSPSHRAKITLPGPQ
jgi:DNA-directed RNA polymerase subunit RPC12/RpoP